MKKMQYKNILGNFIEIKKIEDKELVLTYRFFMSYCKYISNIISSETTKDDEYIKYSKDMNDIRDRLREEIKERSLVMKNYS